MKSKVILMVDDEASFLEIMSIKLKASGFEVVTAQNQPDAIKQAEKYQPDLILMDIHMPNTNGTDVALSIKQNPKTKDARIAFLTSLKDPWPGFAGANSTVSRELGMEDFLEKTDDLNTIVARIKEIIDRK